MGALQGATVARPGGIPSNELSGGVGQGAEASSKYFQNRDLQLREQAQRNFVNRQSTKALNREEAESAAKIAQLNAVTARQVQETQYESEAHPYDIRHKDLENTEAVSRVQESRMKMQQSQLSMLAALGEEGIDPSEVVGSWAQAQQNAAGLANGTFLATWNGKPGAEQGANLYDVNSLNRPTQKDHQISTWTTDQKGNLVEKKHTIPAGASVLEYLSAAMQGQGQLSKALSLQKVQGEMEFRKSEEAKNYAEAGHARAETALAETQQKQMQQFGAVMPTGVGAPPNALKMSVGDLAANLQSQNVPIPKDFEALYALGHYQAAPNTFPSRTYSRGGVAAQRDLASAVSFVRQFINPDWDQKKYQATQKMLDEYASAKPQSPGGNLVAFNTAAQHLGQLAAAADILNRSGGIFGKSERNYPALNAIANEVSRSTGQAVQPNFNAIKMVLVGELGRLMKQAAPDVQEMKQIDKALSDANSPAQFKGVINQLAHAMLAKSSEQIDHYKQWTGSLPPDLYSPMAKQAYQRLGIDVDQFLTGEPSAQTPAPPRPANVPADYIFNPSGPQGAGWYRPAGAQ